MKFYAAFDLHSNNSVLAVLDEAGGWNKGDATLILADGATFY